MIRFLKEERVSLIVLVLLALGMQVFEYAGWLAGPEGRLLDRWLGTAGPGDRANPVSLVEIDDEAYRKCFQETSPMNPRGIETIVRAVAEKTAPAAIGVDILTDSEKYREEYRAMERSLRPFAAKVVWIAGVAGSKYELVSFGGWLLGRADEFVVKPGAVLGYPVWELSSAPEVEWGLPVYPRDEDSGVRRFPREIQLSADPEHSSMREPHSSLAGLLAEMYCRGRSDCKSGKSEEVLVSYGGAAPEPFSVTELFECPASGAMRAAGGGGWNRLRERVKGGVVLIGGTFRQSGDFHDTAAGSKAGLTINAYAVRAEIQGPSIHEAWRPVAVLFDLAVGLAIVGFGVLIKVAIERLNDGRLRSALRHNHVRWTISGGAAIVAIAAIVTWMLFGQGYFLSFLGVAIGVLLHQIADIWIVNPPVEHERESVE